jgi:ABC-type lipoprotein release transport system permease subunit
MMIGMWAGVFSSTFINGWMQQRLRAAVEVETSHIQVHHPEFKNAVELVHFMDDAKEQAEAIRSLPLVDGVSNRIVIQSMVASAETASGVKIIGVDPNDEAQVIGLPDKLIEGTWFENSRQNPIVIGEKLAKKLKVKLRSKIILRLQDMDGNLTGGAFRVVGIFKTVNSSFDEANVWVRYTDLAKLTLIPEGVGHELVIHLSDQEALNKVKSEMKTRMPGYVTEGWQEITPEMGYLTEMGNTMNYMLIIIILLALGFGIVNTMLMVVMERIRELGMLMAVGMNKRRVFIMIVLESIFLSVIGGFSGMALGIIITEIFAKTGIDLSLWGEGLSEWGFAQIVYPEYDLPMVVNIAVMVIFTGIVASIYPAYKGLKLNPSEAIRKI